MVFCSFKNIISSIKSDPYMEEYLLDSTNFYAISLKFKLRSNTLPLDGETCKWALNEVDGGTLCSLNAIEGRIHFLFHCEAYDDIRSEQYEKLEKIFKTNGTCMDYLRCIHNEQDLTGINMEAEQRGHLKEMDFECSYLKEHLIKQEIPDRHDVLENNFVKNSILKQKPPGKQFECKCNDLNSSKEEMPHGYEELENNIDKSTHSKVHRIKEEIQHDSCYEEFENKFYQNNHLKEKSLKQETDIECTCSNLKEHLIKQEMGHGNEEIENNFTKITHLKTHIVKEEIECATGYEELENSLDQISSTLKKEFECTCNHLKEHLSKKKMSHAYEELENNFVESDHFKEQKIKEVQRISGYEVLECYRDQRQLKEKTLKREIDFECTCDHLKDVSIKKEMSYGYEDLEHNADRNSNFEEHSFKGNMLYEYEASINKSQNSHVKEQLLTEKFVGIAFENNMQNCHMEDLSRPTTDLAQVNEVTIEPHKCQHCEQEFMNNNDLFKHLKVHAFERKYEVKFIKYRIDTGDTNNKHYVNLLHTEERERNSHTKGVSNNLTERGRNQHKEETQGQFEHCKNKFTDSYNLKRTHKDTSFECEYCNRKFTRKGHFYRHIRLHTGEKPYECEYCQKKFSRADHLKIHLMIHTNNKPHECKYCQKKFAQTSSLNDHVRTHTGEKPHECKYCQKKFAQTSNLKDHIRIHTGEKPYECKYCQKKCGTSTALKVHLRTHTGEKPHKCKYCEKTFNARCTMIKHLRIHTGEKPYECEYCQKKFTHRNSYNIHLKIHTGEKPHECKYCEKKFYVMSALKIHLRVHTGEKPFECENCNKKFRNVGHLKTHLRKHLNEINE